MLFLKSPNTQIRVTGSHVECDLRPPRPRLSADSVVPMLRGAQDWQVHTSRDREVRRPRPEGAVLPARVDSSALSAPEPQAHPVCTGEAGDRGLMAAGDPGLRRVVPSHCYIRAREHVLVVLK